MHILIVLHEWALIGGTERYALLAGAELARAGHSVTVLCQAAAAEPMPGLRVLVHPPLAKPALSGAERRELERLARAQRADVLYIQAMRNLDALEVLLRVAPAVRYVHDHTLFCPGLNKYRSDGETCRAPFGLECLERYYLRGGCHCLNQQSHPERVAGPLRALRERYRELELHQGAHAVFTNSEYMRASLVQAGLPHARVQRLWYFTLSGTAEQPRGELPQRTREFLAAGQGPVIATAARLTLPDKGVDHLISALAQLRRPFRAVIAGSGPAEPWLREKARAELGECVHFAGWLPQSSIEALYAAAEVVVMPSIWDEPFGLVGIEAMAHQKPVVAFEVGGVSDWLTHELTGLCVPRRDTHAMAQAIQRLLDDPELALRFGRAGRERVRSSFTREAHMSELSAKLGAAAGLASAAH